MQPRRYYVIHGSPNILEIVMGEATKSSIQSVSTYISKKLQSYNYRHVNCHNHNPGSLERAFNPGVGGFLRKQLDGEESASSSLRREADLPIS